ncbi:hypothetical protein BSKO_08154 [Bryopsis sp. KO-2023]|nr:hypothetical protein BSKO_08154 [Bryopsis sp. KO-2023]
MARSVGFSILVAVLVASLVMCSMTGANAFNMGELKHSHRRNLKIFNFITNRGWSTEAGLGLGFVYDDYGGSVDLGPFTFQKDEAVDFDAPTLLERWFPALG